MNFQRKFAPPPPQRPAANDMKNSPAKKASSSNALIQYLCVIHEDVQKSMSVTCGSAATNLMVFQDNFVRRIFHKVCIHAFICTHTPLQINTLSYEHPSSFPSLPSTHRIYFKVVPNPFDTYQHSFNTYQHSLNMYHSTCSALSSPFPMLYRHTSPSHIHPTNIHRTNTYPTKPTPLIPTPLIPTPSDAHPPARGHQCP